MVLKEGFYDISEKWSSHWGSLSAHDKMHSWLSIARLQSDDMWMKIFFFFFLNKDPWWKATLMRDHPQCCTFLNTLQDKVSWRPNFNLTQCPGDTKTIGHQICRKEKSMTVNRTWKAEVHITDNQSWNSCQDWLWSYFWFSFTAYKNMMCFDSAPLTSAKTRCPCSLDELVSMSVFCADLRLEFGGKQ